MQLYNNTLIPWFGPVIIYFHVPPIWSEILYLHSNVDICDYVYYLWLVNCEFTQNRFGGEMSNAGLLTKTETSETYFCYLK